jgi:hypothetical protein
MKINILLIILIQICFFFRVNAGEIKLNQVENVITTEGEKISVKGNILKADFFSGNNKLIENLNFLELKNNRVIYPEEIKNIIFKQDTKNFMMREGVSGGG